MDYIINSYIDLMNNGDPRIKSWPFMSSPLPTLSICSLYVILVKIICPRLMKNRQPFNLRWFMVTYNFFMVYISFHLFYKLGKYGWFGKYNYKCQPVDYSNSEDAIGMMKYAYLYYLTKFLEFADTFFFVLRKKFDHVSTLHVIHHGMMPMSVWWGAKFSPGGHSTFFAFLNSLVHILMYFYYGISSIGPQMNKYLWWKKYMTLVQMVQFIMIFVHSFQLLFRKCEYPQGFMWWIGFHSILFWFLFYDFFYNSYSKKRNLKCCSNEFKNNEKSIKLVNTKNKLENNIHKLSAKVSGQENLIKRKKNQFTSDLLKLHENEFEVGSHQY